MNHLDQLSECLAFYVEIDVSAARWEVKVSTRRHRHLATYHSIDDGGPRTQPSADLLNAMIARSRKANPDFDGETILRHAGKITLQLYYDRETDTANYGERVGLLSNWLFESGFRHVF